MTLSMRKRCEGASRSSWSAGAVLAAMARSEQEDDREGFAGNPLPFSFSFYSGPFPFDFLFYYLNNAVILLFKDPNKFRKM